jgi:hypothetical protein
VLAGGVSGKKEAKYLRTVQPSQLHIHSCITRMITGLSMAMCFDRLRVAAPAQATLLVQYLHHKDLDLARPVATILSVLPHHKFVLDNTSASYALYCRPDIELKLPSPISCLAFTIPLATAVSMISIE